MFLKNIQKLPYLINRFSFSNFKAVFPLENNSSQTIDLRSDTVTKPSNHLRKLMANAQVGDDLFYDDPTVTQLQQKFAELFGKQAAIFVPSGTMANLISLMIHCKEKGDAAVIGDMSHINQWERGNISSVASVMPITLKNDKDGTIDLEDIDWFCKVSDPHYQVNKLICLESTHNQCQGRVLKPSYIKKIKSLANKYSIKMHLDGARCLNAAVFLKIPPKIMTEDFDTVSVCLSKGLGCPIGSLILGTEQDIKQAIILRKLLGGNMRQSGILAQAGIENLKDWEEKLFEDHQNALWIANELKNIQPIEIDVNLIETNIFRFKFKSDFKKFQHNQFSQIMRDKYGILMNCGHKNDSLRIVTHRNVNKKQLENVIIAIKNELK